jgi:hypothetical protein
MFACNVHMSHSITLSISFVLPMSMLRVGKHTIHGYGHSKLYKSLVVVKSKRKIILLFKIHVQGLCTLSYLCVRYIPAYTSLRFFKMHVYDLFTRTNAQYRHVRACVIMTHISTTIASACHLGLITTCVAQITCLLPIASRILHVGFCIDLRQQRQIQLQVTTLTSYSSDFPRATTCDLLYARL